MEYDDRHLDYFGANYLTTIPGLGGHFGIFVGALDPEGSAHLVYLDESAQRELRDELNKRLGEN